MISETCLKLKRDHKWLLSARQDAILLGNDGLEATWSVGK